MDFSLSSDWNGVTLSPPPKHPDVRIDIAADAKVIPESLS
jgi:hypothetical protein